MKNDMLRFVTMLALLFDVTFSIISVWHDDEFIMTAGFIIVWVLCKIWLILFIYANCLYNPKPKEDNVIVFTAKNN